MSLVTNITDLATRIATEMKGVRGLVNGNAADLSALQTTAKGNLVAAVNEVKAATSSAAGINDSTTSTSSTWSSSKTNTELGTKAAASHTHTTANVTGLDAALAGKAATSHGHAIADTSGLQTALDGKAAASHTHTSAAVTDFAASVDARINTVLDRAAAGTALDTLDEIASAIGDDANFAATMTTALGNRVRVDGAQAFTAPQQAQGRTNIGAADAAALATLSSNVGDTTTNFVSTFNAGLL